MQDRLAGFDVVRGHLADSNDPLPELYPGHYRDMGYAQPPGYTPRPYTFLQNTTGLVLVVKFGTNPHEYKLQPGERMPLCGSGVWLTEVRTELPEYSEEGQGSQGGIQAEA